MTGSAADWLRERGAHHDVVAWAEGFGDRWEDLWEACPRADWLLGVAARRGVDRATLVRGACACARFALDYLGESEDRPRRAIEAAEAYVRGVDDPDARREAARIAEAAVDEAPDPAVAAAAMAALAAVRAVDLPEEAALAAASAAQASVLDAGDCAMLSALTYAQRTCADRVREAIPFAAL